MIAIACRWAKRARRRRRRRRSGNCIWLCQQRYLLAIHRALRRRRRLQSTRSGWQTHRSARIRYTQLGGGCCCRCGWHEVHLAQMNAQIRVLCLLVASQIDLALERLVAQLAGEGLVAGVFAGVRYQVRALAEGFSAHLTLVRFFTCKRYRKRERERYLVSWKSIGFCCVQFLASSARHFCFTPPVHHPSPPTHAQQQPPSTPKVACESDKRFLPSPPPSCWCKSSSLLSSSAMASPQRQPQQQPSLRPATPPHSTIPLNFNFPGSSVCCSCGLASTLKAQTT